MHASLPEIDLRHIDLTLRDGAVAVDVYSKACAQWLQIVQDLDTRVNLVDKDETIKIAISCTLAHLVGTGFPCIALEALSAGPHDLATPPSAMVPHRTLTVTGTYLEGRGRCRGQGRGRCREHVIARRISMEIAPLRADTALLRYCAIRLRAFATPYCGRNRRGRVLKTQSRSFGTDEVGVIENLKALTEICRALRRAVLARPGAIEGIFDRQATAQALAALAHPDNNRRRRDSRCNHDTGGGHVLALRTEHKHAAATTTIDRHGAEHDGIAAVTARVGRQWGTGRSRGQCREGS